MPLIQTINNEDYSLVHDFAFTHDGCIVDVGCVGWDWCNTFIGKKRVVGVDPFETITPEGTELFQGLLGPFNGKSSLDFQGIGSSAMAKSNQEDAQQFNVLNWKTFCNTFNIDKVSVLKLNIEGAEYPLLNSLDKDDFEKIDQIAVSFHNWMNNSWDLLTESSIELLKKVGFEIECIFPKLGWYLAVKREGKSENLFERAIKKEDSKITIVTGLWDLGRGDINGWAKRDFQQYKNRFFELLKSDVQMCIWIPKELEQEVLNIRGDRPTQIYIRELEDFKLWFPFFTKLQEIRTNPDWHNSAGWLSESPQAALEYYNPMMMCKMFMVNDSAIMNPFNSKYFYWIDGGLTSTVSQGYFNHDNVFNKLKNYTDSIDKLTFITYPYEGNSEIHGFERAKMAEYCGVDFVNKISRGGFWGGKKDQIHTLNAHYYSILQDTITNGYMGADECLFTILTYNYPELIQPFEIEGNGLVWPFFEMLKSNELPEVVNKVALYVIGFNFPSQLETLCKSFEAYDKSFLEKPKKFLLNNSTDRSTDQAFAELCKKYDFEEIKKDNIGICGGRQFCAEHADENGFEYHMFFEDDMFFYNGTEEFCRNGFKRKIQNFYDNVMHIIQTEKFDFLKFNFSEFYGDNTRQWSWHNIPDNVRQELFPENPARTDGNIEKAPYMKYNSIKSYKGVPYATGEVFYCNWPQVVSREGNRKMFIETKYSYPFEQTWMSHFYQDTVRGKLKPGILLATPTEHNRFEFYTKEERREN